MKSRLPKVKLTMPKTGNVDVDVALRDLVNSVPDSDDVLNQVFLDNLAMQDGVIMKIPHKLGRKLRGWLVIRNNTANVIFWDHQKDNPNPEKTLWLQADNGNPTISLMVF